MPLAPKLWLVSTPATWTEPILDDGSGPTYHEQAVLVVRCRAGRGRAKVLALRAWRRDNRARRRRGYGAPDFLDDPDLNPFAEMQVAPYELDAPYELEEAPA